jgi:dimethylhistidine N-methyltransferase
MACYQLTDYTPTEQSISCEVLSGLSARQKRIAPQLRFDDAGAALFQRLAHAREYYITASERQIIKDAASDLAREIGPAAQLFELGSGTQETTRLLLESLPQLVNYIPVDIARTHLLETAHALSRRYPSLDVLPVCADPAEPLVLPLGRQAKRTIAFLPGSMIGGMPRPDAWQLLCRLSGMLGRGDGLLVSVDATTDGSAREHAYGNAAAAALNLNLLTRLNRELSASFAVNHFHHRVAFNPDIGRVEIGLVSDRPQLVRVGRHMIALRERELITTQYAYQYTVAEFTALAKRAGFYVRRRWSNPTESFNLFYFST